MAQIERAILLARPIATSMRGLRLSIRCSQVPSCAPFRQAQRTMTIAPVIKSRRISRCPILEVFPRTCLPPVECCKGTSPSQAAKSRPRRNTSIGGAKVSIAMAVIGQTPGIVCRRRVMAPRLASHAIAFSSSADFLRKPDYLIEVYARQFDHEQRK